MRGRRNTEADFWTHVQKSASCWLWSGDHDDDGYGRWWFEGRNHRAHRWALLGRKDDGQGVVRHTCNVASCVRPDHLILGDQSQNVLDEVRAGTHARLVYSDALVETVRADYAAGHGTTRALAAKHGMSKSQVYSIVSGQTRTVRRSQ